MRGRYDKVCGSSSVGRSTNISNHARAYESRQTYRINNGCSCPHRTISSAKYANENIKDWNWVHRERSDERHNTTSVHKKYQNPTWTLRACCCVVVLTCEGWREIMCTNSKVQSRSVSTRPTYSSSLTAGLARTLSVTVKTARVARVRW